MHLQKNAYTCTLLHKLRMTRVRVLHVSTTHAHVLAFNANTPIYIHINALIHMHTPQHLQKHTHIVQTCVHTHTHTHTHTHLHTFKYMHMHMHTCLNKYACINTYISTHADMHTYTLTLLSCTRTHRYSTYKHTCT